MQKQNRLDGNDVKLKTRDFNQAKIAFNFISFHLKTISRKLENYGLVIVVSTLILLIPIRFIIFGIEFN